MSVKKQYLKSKPACRVTFRLTKKAAAGASTACVAGDFNNWQPASTPMKALKNGDFTITLNLEAGREYQYRYFIDGRHWITDDQADRYTGSGFSDSQNGVVAV